MSVRLAGALAIATWMALMSAPLRAEPPTLPPMVGLSENTAKERATLFAELTAAKDEAEAREIENRLWKFWLSPADDESRRLLAVAGEAQLRFDYGNAVAALQELVKHQPRFAEGWNQLAYALFLAGSLDASLAALERTLELEPMHFAALAGKAIILTQQGNQIEAQTPLKRALAINPWLKERNLLMKEPGEKL
jgi:tetratricopeptide (TPR) repeat protein